MSWAIGFFFGNWKRLAALAFVLVAFAIWARFQVYDAQHKADRAALARESALRAAAEAQVRLNQNATHQADITTHVERVSRQTVVQAQEAVSHAQDFHALYLAWSSGIVRVRNDETPTTA